MSDATYATLMGALGTFILLCGIATLGAIALMGYDKLTRWWERRSARRRRLTRFMRSTAARDAYLDMRGRWK
jgi:hypothetical protein